MRIMITGGGTGGHISPALAIIEELRRRDPRLLLQWVGKSGSMEERASRNEGVPFRCLEVEGWPRKKSLRRLWSAFKLVMAGLRSAMYLRAFRPQLIVGVGGYVALPLMYAAQRMGFPTVIHEQNKRLGMTNRLLAPRATHIFLSYPDTIGNFPRERATVVGNPVRAGFSTPPARSAARAEFGLDPDLPMVLVVGGSQGAATLNRAVGAMLPDMKPQEFQILWMTGKTDAAAAQQSAENSSARVLVLPYIDNMVAACAAADLVVARAGASSTAELAVMGKPSILVPYPHATDNHQEENARAFETAGAARLLLDKHCHGDVLLDEIRELLADPAQLEAMAKAARALGKPLAAEAIAERIMFLVFGQEVEAAPE